MQEISDIINAEMSSANSLQQRYIKSNYLCNIYAI
jgi:hypothetical protein